MVALDDLAGWTPVALHLDGPEPSIDWADFSGERFTEPFFDQTIQRLLSGDTSRAIVRTGLDALLAHGDAPALEPCGIIFHLSRCGSTVLSRLLATMPETVVISEPAPINALLRADPAMVHEDVQVQVLRLLVRALGRVRLGTERHLVLKLSSWNIRRLGLIRRAFPSAKLVWTQRAPVEVMSSLLAGPPGWLQIQREPALAAYLFGIGPGECAALDLPGFAARTLRSMLDSAVQAENMAVVDYRELPDVVWTRLAPLFGIPVDNDEIAAMRDESRYYAKDTARQAFTPDSERKRVVPDEVAALARESLDPLYDALDARRRSA